MATLVRTSLPPSPFGLSCNLYFALPCYLNGDNFSIKTKQMQTIVIEVCLKQKSGKCFGTFGATKKSFSLSGKANLKWFLLLTRSLFSSCLSVLLWQHIESNPFLQSSSFFYLNIECSKASYLFINLKTNIGKQNSFRWTEKKNFPIFIHDIKNSLNNHCIYM